MIANVLQREIKRLTEILLNGLPTCYTSFEDFLFDFFPDFSWVMDEAQKEYALLLADQHWCVLAVQVKAKYGYDFQHQIKLALTITGVEMRQRDRQDVDRCAQCGRLEEGHSSRMPDGTPNARVAQGVMSHQFISSRNLPRDQWKEVVS